MHEELDGVGLLVHPGQRERGQPRRPVPEGLDKLGIGQAFAEAGLRPRGVPRQRPAEHAGRGVGAALPHDQMRRQIPGLPAGAECGRVGAGLSQQRGESDAFFARVPDRGVPEGVPP